MTKETLNQIANEIEKADKRFIATPWQNYGKSNIYVELKNGKKITVHFGNMKLYPNRPGAYTEAETIKEVLNGLNFNFEIN
jgi:hypothetical protein